LSLTDLDAGDDIQRGNPVPVEWDPPGDGGEVNWEVNGDCVWIESGEAADDGTFEIAAEDVRVQNNDLGEECEVTVTLERVVRGEVDSAFGEGGRFYLIQRRTVIFNSTPADDEAEEE
jgi:hypothetical protein